MHAKNLGRRDFHKLSLAAVSGVLAGSFLASCKSKDAMATPQSGANPMLSEPHVCRGLNTCKGQDPSGANQCAGMGQCATVGAHSCHGENDCKGQGGCKDSAGRNDCKGQGACAVPLKPDTWKKARANFEAAMKAQGKQVGPAPAKA